MRVVRWAAAIVAAGVLVTSARPVSAAPTQDQSILTDNGTNVILGQSPEMLIASATSGLPVTLTADTPTTCTLSGHELTFVAVGRCRVFATQPGDDVWLPTARFIYYDVQYRDRGGDRTVRRGATFTVTVQLRTFDERPISDGQAQAIQCELGGAGVRIRLTVGSTVLQGCAGYQKSTGAFRLGLKVPRTFTPGTYLTQLSGLSRIDNVQVASGGSSFFLTVV